MDLVKRMLDMESEMAERIEQLSAEEKYTWQNSYLC